MGLGSHLRQFLTGISFRGDFHQNALSYDIRLEYRTAAKVQENGRQIASKECSKMHQNALSLPGTTIISTNRRDAFQSILKTILSVWTIVRPNGCQIWILEATKTLLGITVDCISTNSSRRVLVASRTQKNFHKIFPNSSKHIYTDDEIVDN